MDVFRHRLLIATALLEITTGLTLSVIPSLFVQLLLGEAVAGPGLAVGRVAGFALIALGVACWPGWEFTWDNSFRLPQSLMGMLIYNLLVAAYLSYIGATSESVGIALWPGVALHSVLTLLCVRELFRH